MLKYKVVVYLAKERKETGTDSLAENRPEVIDSVVEGLAQEYGVDESLAHREAAAFYMHYRLYANAVNESWLAVKCDPLKLANISPA